MQPVYAGETSSLSPVGSIGDFAPRLFRRSLYRMFMSYFMRDLNVVSVFLLGGIPTMTFGVAWSAYHWIQGARLHTPMTIGTVIIGCWRSSSTSNSSCRPSCWTWAPSRGGTAE